MKNAYQKLMENVHAPEELSDRVVCAARRRETAQTGPKRLKKGGFRPVLRGAVCAACALALVAGTVRFYPAERAEGPVGEAPGSTVMVPEFSFGLTAYAAGTGETIAPNANGGLAFSVENGMRWTEEDGYFTGCLFQVTGEQIRQVRLSLDRGGFYRWRLLEDLTETQMREIREAQERGELAPASIDQDENGRWSMQEMTKLGGDVTEDYDPAVRYGIWVHGAEAAAWREDARAASQASVDQMDGARLTVTVIFEDGSEQTDTYRLSTGRLRVSWNEDGSVGGLLPGLAGDDEAYLYGVYAVSEEESRWFTWPVQGSRTVSLSMPFSYRVVPGGGQAPDFGDGENPEEPLTDEELAARTTFHTGIDIPAPEGEAVLAAADGTVTEVGFNASEGNYLKIDHGDGLTTMYAHCRNVDVKEGDTVQAGEMIGAVGKTGMATGPHLHFEVRQDGVAQNPVAYFDSEVRDTLTAE